MTTNLQALNKAYEMLEEKLAQDEFLYKTWMDLADLFPKNSRRSWEIRRRAAIIQRELQICGHPKACIVSGGEGTSYCSACEGRGQDG